MSELKIECVYDSFDYVTFGGKYDNDNITIRIDYTDTKESLSVNINKSHAKQIIVHLQEQFGL